MPYLIALALAAQGGNHGEVMGAHKEIQTIYIGGLPVLHAHALIRHQAVHYQGGPGGHLHLEPPGQEGQIVHNLPAPEEEHLPAVAAHQGHVLGIHLRGVLVHILHFHFPDIVPHAALVLVVLVVPVLPGGEVGQLPLVNLVLSQAPLKGLLGQEGSVRQICQLADLCPVSIQHGPEILLCHPGGTGSAAAHHAEHHNGNHQRQGLQGGDDVVFAGLFHGLSGLTDRGCPRHRGTLASRPAFRGTLGARLAAAPALGLALATAPALGSLRAALTAAGGLLSCPGLGRRCRGGV